MFNLKFGQDATTAATKEPVKEEKISPEWEVVVKQELEVFDTEMTELLKEFKKEDEDTFISLVVGQFMRHNIKDLIAALYGENEKADEMLKKAEHIGVDETLSIVIINKFDKNQMLGAIPHTITQEVKDFYAEMASDYLAAKLATPSADVEEENSSTVEKNEVDLQKIAIKDIVDIYNKTPKKDQGSLAEIPIYIEKKYVS